MSASRDTSGSREEQRVAHANLIHRLADHMSGQEIKRMKEYLLLRRTITSKQNEELDGLPAIVHCLEMEMKLIIGERDGYKVLIDALKTIKKDALADEVEQHQKKFCTDGEADKADKDESRGLQSDLDSLRKVNRLLRSQVLEYNRKLITKINDYRRLQEELGTTKKEKTELQKLLHTVTMEKTELREELDTTTKEKTELQKVFHTVTMEKTELQEELDTTKTEKTELQEELDTTKREKTELQKVLRTITMEKTELREELDRKRKKDKKKPLEKLFQTRKKKLQEQGQEGGVQGAEGGTEDIQRYQGEEGVQLAKGPRDIERCREVVTKKYGTDIQSIVNLGNRFAVAYWDQSKEKINGVDIYDMSGVKQRTLKAHIEGILQLAVTPDKRTLVAVCDEGCLGPYAMYTIRMFDPVSGSYIRSSPQFRAGWKVRRFDVCDGRQFVILHGYGDNVSVVGEDGSVVLTEKVESPSNFISSGGRKIYTSRVGGVDVYEITKDHHLKYIATSQEFHWVRDVSATAAGEVTVTCRRGERWYLGRATFKDNKFSEWKYKYVDSQYQALVSVGGDHVVVAGNDNNDKRRILRVFKEEGERPATSDVAF